ncbi:MAG TPA: NUDIX hydrolase [Dehalococcoidia bacterium]|nr:NUDIX hydrolase [Dehalococcoidia bacterium]
MSGEPAGPGASYCINCGARLETREAFGKQRLVCPDCGHVHFDDPKVAVGVVVEMDGGILLARRNHEPQIGRWSFPSGFVDAGEVLEEAAAREVQEETGVEVTIDRLLGVYSARGERTIFVAYAGHASGGRLECGDECLEVAVFPPDALPELAFPHDAAILDAWARGRA